MVHTRMTQRGFVPFILFGVFLERKRIGLGENLGFSWKSTSKKKKIITVSTFFLFCTIFFSFERLVLLTPVFVPFHFMNPKLSFFIIYLY